MTLGAVEPRDLSRRRFFRDLVTTEPNDAPGGPWRPVESLAAGSGDVFWSGWAADDAVFVVGDAGTVFRLDGGTWQRLAVPVNVPIHAIWGPNRERLYAVGWMGAILHFDGQDWHHLRGAVVGDDGKYAAVEENSPLFDVAGDADGNVWTVGDDGQILALEDGRWVREESGTSAHLRALAPLSDERVIAAGADGTVLLRSAAGAWQELDCPVRSNFQAAVALDGDQVLLAGGRYFADSNGFRGDLVRWRDGRFEPLEGGGPFSRFRALAAYRDGALAVGDKGQIHFVHGHRIDRLESGTGHDLLGIVPLPSGEALAVGDFGTVLTARPDFHEALAAPSAARGEAAPLWERTESGSDRQLWGLWHDPRDGALYACGEEGTLLHWSDERWERLPPAGAIGLHCLCDAPDGGILAAGQLGEIHHFDGAVWRKQFDLHVDVTILSLWSDGAGQAFAVGDEGLILRWDGETWQRMNSGTKSALYGLWGVDAAHLLAVGDFGAILRWNGERWDEFHAGTEAFLFDVWGDRLDNIFVVGLSGTIGHFSGQRWTVTPTRAREDILALSGGQGLVHAVGAAGLALCHDGRAWRREATGFDGGLRAISASSGEGVFAAGDGGTILRRRGRDHVTSS